MNSHCPCTRAAYIALTALVGFACVFLFQSGGDEGVRAETPKPTAPGIIIDPGGAIRTAPQIVPIKARIQPPRNFINFALASNGAVAAGGQNAKLLIDGNDSEYTGSAGFAMTQWNNNPPQFLLVTLKQPTSLGCVKFLLWDRSDERFYRYKLEVSGTEIGEDWKSVADRSDPAAECKSWQVVTFATQMVRRIRLTGTYNSANAGFHVVELQAFIEAPPPKDNEPERMDF